MTTIKRKNIKQLEYTYNNPLSITSQFSFCGLPFRLDTYAGCSIGCHRTVLLLLTQLITKHNQIIYSYPIPINNYKLRFIQFRIFATPLTSTNTLSMFKKISLLALTALLFASCWKDKSPENLIRLKDKFKSTVASFEKRKETANKNVNKGLETLNALKTALEDTKNEDKEFAKVYGDWEKVNKRVERLNKEYEDLKSHAANLFNAMETQTNSLSDETSRNTLNGTIKKARVKYNGTLANTSKAIERLRLLHGDAVEVVKALEVAAALNSFDNINDQMKSIEGRVDGIMQELNVAVVESKKLYEKKITELGEE